MMKLKSDERIDSGKIDVTNTMPLHLGAFNLGNCKRTMTKFVLVSNGYGDN